MEKRSMPWIEVVLMHDFEDEMYILIPAHPESFRQERFLEAYVATAIEHDLWHYTRPAEKVNGPCTFHVSVRRTRSCEERSDADAWDVFHRLIDAGTHPALVLAHAVSNQLRGVYRYEVR